MRVPAKGAPSSRRYRQAASPACGASPAACRPGVKTARRRRFFECALYPRIPLLAARFIWPGPLSVGTYPQATTSRASTWKDDPVPQMHRTTRKPPRWSVGRDPAPHSWAAMASPDPSVGGGPTAKSGAPGPSSSGPSSSHAGQGAPTHPTATTENRND
jgi:hypothetical protein